MKVRYPFLYLILLSAVAAAVLLAVGHGRRGNILSKPVLSRQSVAVVDVMGVITSSGALSDGTVSASALIEVLKKYGDDNSVKALVLRIDSPGGTVVAAQEVYNAVTRLREEKNKVVFASMADIAASGGYYIACAADRIYANEGTITGSIGVIMEFPNIEGLLRKVGVKTTTIKSGEFKDTGSAFRQMSEKEMRVLQELIDNVYDQFVQAVQQGRGMSEGEVRSLADGRIYTGRQARELGLVDELGDLEIAVRDAAEAAGIEGKPHVVRQKKKVRFWDLLESRLGVFLPLRSGDYPAVRLLYLWN